MFAPQRTPNDGPLTVLRWPTTTLRLAGGITQPDDPVPDDQLPNNRLSTRPAQLHQRHAVTRHPEPDSDRGLGR